MTGGKAVWVRSEITDSRTQSWFDRTAAALGVTNGQITREQYATYMQQRMAGGWGGGRSGGAPGSAPAGGPGAPGGSDGGDRTSRWADSMFRRQDANGDGVLNYDEMSESLRSERDKYDTNRDGFIDANEFKAYFQGFIQQRQAERNTASDPSSTQGGSGGGWNNGGWQGGGWNGGGGWGGGGGWQGQMPTTPPSEEERKPVVYRSGSLPKELPSWFREIDTDSDAQLGLYEWKNSGRSLDEFRRMDRNGDGFLTVSEVIRHQDALAKNNPSTGGPDGALASNASPGNSFGRGGGPGRGGWFGAPGGQDNGMGRNRGGRGGRFNAPWGNGSNDGSWGGGMGRGPGGGRRNRGGAGGGNGSGG
jgi:Ca2+-binding EF-hand superfamily protein